MRRLKREAAPNAARKLLLAGLACALIQGCASGPGQSLRPTAPPSAIQSANALAASLRPQASTSPANLDELKAVVQVLRNDIVSAAEAKNKQSWNAGLATLVGGSMATIGSVSSRPGLMNSGFLLALLGLSGEQFYKPANTIEIHLDADSKLQCIGDLTFDVSEADRLLAVKGDAPGSEDAQKAVETLNQAINSSMLIYRRSLLGIRPGTPSRDEILGFLKRYAEPPPVGTKGIPTQEELKQIQAAKKFIGLTTSLQACVKLGIPVVK